MEGIMESVDDEMLKSMAESIVAEVGPERVVLFGSRARGDARPDSDVDLLVVESEPFHKGHSRSAELARIRLAVAGFQVPKDILVFCRAEVDEWAGSLNHVIARAFREGRTLYAKG